MLWWTAFKTLERDPHVSDNFASVLLLALVAVCYGFFWGEWGVFMPK